MRALITGSRGFVGRYLVHHLAEEGWEISDFNLRDGQDIRNYEDVRNKLDIVRPDAIFHLAAQAFVPESFINPKRTFEVNTLGSLNILEAVRQLRLNTHILLVGTSEEYGPSKPYEDALPEPRSPYAISKLAMDNLGNLYSKAYSMNVVVTRAFNHTGPGRGEMYAESSFARQIAEYEAKKRNIVRHGNLSSIRNYTDVRDIVRAYEKAIMLPSGTYNVCSERNVSMEEVMNMLIANSKFSAIPLEKDPALTRPSDFSFKKPHCAEFRSLTGWEPGIPLEQTMKDLLDYWRERV